jgi:hypothetical protein
MSKLQQIQTIIQKDLGNRGITHLINEGNKNDLKISCEKLLEANSVAIITGCFVHQKACETDVLIHYLKKGSFRCLFNC